MRFNPLPFVFAPGVVLAGLLLGGLRGTLIATAVWAAIVAIATLCAYLRRTEP